MKLEHTVDKQITSYPDLYWDIDRPHARIRVLDEMFLNASSDFEWTRDGYLFNTGIQGVSVQSAPPYGRRAFGEFVDVAWLEENKGRQRKGAWRPSPFGEDCNLFNIPDNIQPDYLEAAYEVAKRAHEILKSTEPNKYVLMPSDAQIMRNVDIVLDGKDDDHDVSHSYHKAHEDGILTLEWAIGHEEANAKSKMNRMVYALEDDFFPRYDEIKKRQHPIKVFLDDNRPTPDGFDVHVYDSEQLINMLKYKNISQVSLDNDLGPYCSQEGYKVAQHIEKMAFNNEISRMSINVHSANTVASKEMTIAIEQCDKFWTRNETTA